MVDVSIAHALGESRRFRKAGYLVHARRELTRVAAPTLRVRIARAWLALISFGF
ncbi:MAG: hypothetical protein QM831_44065 [Kofleriaceae bacterium]